MPAPIPYDQRAGQREAVAPAPPPPDVGWLEGIPATFRTSVYSQPGYMDGQRRQAYHDLLEAIAPYNPSPLDRARGQAGVLAPGEMQAVYQALNTGDNDRAYGMIWALADKVRKADPKALQGVAPTRDAFDKGWQANMTARQQRDAAVASRTPMVPWLLGNVAGEAVRPINIATLPLGGGTGGLIMRMAREAAFNAAVEVVEQPMINAERRAQGRPELTAGERVAGVAFAGAAGAAIPAGIAGLGKVAGAGTGVARSAFEKTVAANWDRLPQGLRERWSRGAELDDADLADLVELHVGRDNMSQDEVAAVDVLEREGWLARANPFAKNGEGVQFHDAALRGTIAGILNDTPQAPRPAFTTEAGGGLRGRARGDTAIGSGTVAGDAQARFMGKVRRAESGGDDVAAATGSSAYGRYKFTKGTWLHYYLERYGREGLSNEQIYAKRANGALQDRLMADMTADSAARLRRMGAPMTEGNLYLMHFLGPADARKVLHAEPGTPLAGLISERSIAANAKILAGKTAGDVLAFVDRKMGSSGSGELAPRLDVDAARIADADLATRLQAEADRLQAELVAAQRSVTEPATREDPAPVPDQGRVPLADLRMADGASEQWLAAAAVEREARAQSLRAALDNLPQHSSVAPVRSATSVTEARNIAGQEIVNRPLHDAENSIEVTVSRKNLNKMGSASAVRNSTAAEDHALALANVDHLFAQAHEYHAGPDVKAMERGEDPARSDIGSVRQFIAAMDTPDGPVAVRMVVKDMRAKGAQKPLYTLQTIAVGERVGEKSGTMAPPADGIEPTSHKAVGRTGPQEDIGGPGGADKAARDLAEGERIADLPEAERTAFRDPAGESAKAQAQSLLHDARAMLGRDGMDDPELARLIDDIDEDHAVIDTLRSCML